MVPHRCAVLLLLVMICPFTIGSGWAWTSGPECPPGPEQARRLWSAAASTPPNEHAMLFLEAMRLAGLPIVLATVPVTLHVVTDGSDLNAEQLANPSPPCIV